MISSIFIILIIFIGILLLGAIALALFGIILIIIKHIKKIGRDA